MSTAIMADGSVVVRLAWQTVHLDVRTRAIHLRSPKGAILESFPQVAADRVRIIRGPEERHHLLIELRSGRSLSLGHATSHERAMKTARVVADLTRCKVEVSEGEVLSLPGPSHAFVTGATMEQDLGALYEELAVWEDETTPPRIPTPRVRASGVALRTAIVIRDDDEEDPLDQTACRPLSIGEAAMRVAENDDHDTF